MLATEKTTQKSTPRITASLQCYGFVLAISFTYLYFALFLSPRVPFLLGGDQAFYWMGAQRILSGQTIFLDFFQYTPPGTDLVYAAFFKIFGDQVWVTNAVVLTLGVLSTCLCFSLSRQLMKTSHALIAAGLFLVVIYGVFLNATNHSFAVFFILLAVRVSMDRLNAGNIAFSGAFLALSAFFNQAHGAAALTGLIAFIALNKTRTNVPRMSSIKAISSLALTFALVLLCFGAYYLGTAGFAKVWFCLVTSVLHSVSRSAGSLSFLGVPSGLSRFRVLPYVFVYLLLPLIYCLALIECWRSRRDSSFSRDRVMLLSLVGFFLLSEVAVSVNPLRFFAIAMPGIILLMWAVERMPLPSPMLIVGATTILAAVSVHQIVEKHRQSSAQGDLPGGRFATTSESYEKLRWLSQRVQAGEFFLQAGWPGVYLPLKVQSPIYMHTLNEWDCVIEKDIEPAIQQMDARKNPLRTMDAHA